MNDFDERLATCFSAVFPNRSREEIVSASRDSIAEWDSLAAITLLSLVQQEFDTDIDLFDFERLGSFRLILNHLQENVGAAGGKAPNG